MRLAIHQFPYNDDNYGVLLHDAERGETALVDAGDAEAAEAALDEAGWPLTQIWITHHHGDHTAGLAALAGDGVEVFGPAGQQSWEGVELAAYWQGVGKTLMTEHLYKRPKL